MDDPLFEASQPPVGIGHNAAKPLQDAILEAIALEQRIENLGADLTMLTRMLRNLKDVQIPALFQQIMPGTTDLTVDGWKVELFDEYIGGPTKDEDKRAIAYAWLENNGGADIIKTTVSVPLPKEDHYRAVALAKELADRGLVVTCESSVHVGTLKAWVKECVRNGKEVDLAALGMICRVSTDIKKAKEPRVRAKK